MDREVEDAGTREGLEEERPMKGIGTS